MSPEGPRFQITGLFITKAHFEVMPSDLPAGTVATGRIPVDIGVSATVQVTNDPTRALVKLDFRIAPDPKSQAYRIEVHIAGLFSCEDATSDDILKFAKHAAPSILYPYVREYVHSMTKDAPNGVLRLDPMNITALLNQNEWAMATPPQPSDAPPSP